MFRCDECDVPLTDADVELYDADEGAYLCAQCRAMLARWAGDDHQLDDPRHGQAADLNRRYG